MGFSVAKMALSCWQVEMIPFFRSLGFTQMLTNGAEGYRAKTTHDSSAPTAYPFNNWLNDGRKGARRCPLPVPRWPFGSPNSCCPVLLCRLWNPTPYDFAVAALTEGAGCRRGLCAQPQNSGDRLLRDPCRASPSQSFQGGLMPAAIYKPYASRTGWFTTHRTFRA